MIFRIIIYEFLELLPADLRDRDRPKPFRQSIETRSVSFQRGRRQNLPFRGSERFPRFRYRHILLQDRLLILHFIHDLPRFSLRGPVIDCL